MPNERVHTYVVLLKDIKGSFSFYNSIQKLARTHKYIQEEILNLDKRNLPCVCIVLRCIYVIYLFFGCGKENYMTKCLVHANLKISKYKEKTTDKRRR